MHYKTILNAFIMSCNIPYNALYGLIHNYNHGYNTYVMPLDSNTLKHMTNNQSQI